MTDTHLCAEVVHKCEGGGGTGMRSAEAYSWGKCNNVTSRRGRIPRLRRGGNRCHPDYCTETPRFLGNGEGMKNAALPIMGRTGMVNDYP